MANCSIIILRYQKEKDIAKTEHLCRRTESFDSLVAFARREDISTILQSSYDRLALIDPRNDSQVIFYDAIIPGSTLLSFVRADHWAVAMPFSQDAPLLSAVTIDKNEFPREVLLEEIIRIVEENLLDSD